MEIADCRRNILRPNVGLDEGCFDRSDSDIMTLSIVCKLIKPNWTRGKVFYKFIPLRRPAAYTPPRICHRNHTPHPILDGFREYNLRQSLLGSHPCFLPRYRLGIDKGDKETLEEAWAWLAHQELHCPQPQWLSR